MEIPLHFVAGFFMPFCVTTLSVRTLYFRSMETVTPLKAMEIMRELARQNIPCTIKYLSLNGTDRTSKGIVEEKNIILMQGYRRNQSKKAEILASFMRMDTGENRQFYWPLLCELNGRKIKP